MKPEKKTSRWIDRALASGVATLAFFGGENAAAQFSEEPLPAVARAEKRQHAAQLARELKSMLRVHGNASESVPEETVRLFKRLGSEQEAERMQASAESKTVLKALLDDLEKAQKNVFESIRPEETEQEAEDAAIHAFKGAIKYIARQAHIGTPIEQETAGKLLAETMEMLVRQLGDDAFSKRQSASLALALTGVPAIPAVEAHRKSPYKEIQYRAENFFAELGQSDKHRAGYFLRSAEELEKLGPAAAAAVPQLAMLLEIENKELKVATLKALGAIGPDAAPAVPELMVALKDPDYEVREQSALALLKIGPRAAAAVAALTARLQDEHFYVKRAAASALGSIGEPSQPAIPALILAMQDKNATVRESAVGALGEIGAKTPEVVAGLARLAETEEYVGVKREAIRLLGQCSALAKPAVPMLSKALAHESAEIRRVTAIALGKIGRDAEKALPALQEFVGTRPGKAAESYDEKQIILAIEAAEEAIEKIAGKNRVR